MNFKEGQILNIENNNLCLLKIINYQSKVYGLFSLETNKLVYLFYEIVDTGNGYNLFRVVDDYLNSLLLSMFEEIEKND